MSNEKGANYSGGIHRLPPGYEWRHVGGRWQRCKRISSMRAARIQLQLLQRSERGVFTSREQEAAARALTWGSKPSASREAS